VQRRQPEAPVPQFRLDLQRAPMRERGVVHAAGVRVPCRSCDGLSAPYRPYLSRSSSRSSVTRATKRQAPQDQPSRLHDGRGLPRTRGGRAFYRPLVRGSVRARLDRVMVGNSRLRRLLRAATLARPASRRRCVKSLR
jgi:hypothetical protein